MFGFWRVLIWTLPLVLLSSRFLFYPILLFQSHLVYAIRSHVMCFVFSLLHGRENDRLDTSLLFQTRETTNSFLNDLSSTISLILTSLFVEAASKMAIYQPLLAIPHLPFHHRRRHHRHDHFDQPPNHKNDQTLIKVHPQAPSKSPIKAPRLLIHSIDPMSL